MRNRQRKCHIIYSFAFIAYAVVRHDLATGVYTSPLPDDAHNLASKDLELLIFLETSRGKYSPQG